ncbi:MAG: DUF1269 domain-containing protein [Chloroflexaceae bacterium]|nr:DUF1269 domain-containing protein [Chloroflexaceae bacterium]
MELIICTFDGNAKQAELQAIMHQFNRWQRLQTDILSDHTAGEVMLDNIALVKKDHEGHISVSETIEAYNRQQGLLRNALVGLASVLIAGPLGLPLAIGTMVGGSAINLGLGMTDLGFQNEELLEIGQQLEEGSTALITLVPTGESSDTLITALQTLDGHMTHRTLSTDAIAKLTEPIKEPDEPAP